MCSRRLGKRPGASRILDSGELSRAAFSPDLILVQRRCRLHEHFLSALHRLQKRFEDRIKAINMEIHIDSSLPDTAILDGDRAVQILTNLLQNAIKFVDPSSGQIKLTATFDESASMLTMRADDNGRGMSPEGLSKIFQPWAQAEGAGAHADGATCRGMMPPAVHAERDQDCVRPSV